VIEIGEVIEINRMKMTATERHYNCMVQYLFIPVGAILIFTAHIVLYFSWPTFNSIAASVWFFVLMILGSTLVFYRRKLIVSKLFLVEKRTYFGLFLTTKKLHVKDFVKIKVTKEAYPPGQLYSDPESSVDGCFVSFIPKRGNEEFDVSDYISGGSNKNAIKGKIKFAKELGNLTDLRVEYSHSVRAKISDDEIRVL
jgi:hypothetical protein